MYLTGISEIQGFSDNTKLDVHHHVFLYGKIIN